ncbi:F0F1 ATP synthase subunit epsilon [bacterium NHP-B]|nr:F0F1 ATP synthase subunit epsilon [bacterium NHP-B]
MSHAKAANLHLTFSTPAGSVFDDRVEAVFCKALDGHMALYKGHAPLLSVLSKGLLRLMLPGKDEPVIYETHEGILSVRPHKVKIFSTHAVLFDEDTVTDPHPSTYVW